MIVIGIVKGLDEKLTLLDRNKRRIHWKKGGSEVISFAMVVPILTIIVASLISFTQIAMTREALQYVAYSSGRAAVVSETFDTAVIRAEEIARLQMESVAFTNGEPKVEVRIIDENRAWVKGNYVRVTVSCKVDTLIPTMSGNYSNEIVMMIERTDPDIINPQS